GRLVGVYSDPGRDPRKHTVSVVYTILGAGGLPHGGDDAASAEWVPLRPWPRLAFDHGEILRDGVESDRNPGRPPRPSARPR
ncbi:MAG: hypothetical protein L3K10_08205, partial [Thermoplasmata archaeon]|nr:hypothetical protein [Thermoplasmata archaeon]